MTFFEMYKKYTEKFEGFSIINLDEDQEDKLILLMDISLNNKKPISKQDLIDVIGVDEDDPNILI